MDYACLIGGILAVLKNPTGQDWISVDGAYGESKIGRAKGSTDSDSDDYSGSIPHNKMLVRILITKKPGKKKLQARLIFIWSRSMMPSCS
jgi:hypothetical protein